MDIKRYDWDRIANDLTRGNYKLITTFGDDFDIADAFGIDAIQDTYNRAFNSWKTDYKYITELCMILNWKCHMHYQLGNQEYSELYSKLFYKLQRWCYSHLKNDELTYFLDTTD